MFYTKIEAYMAAERFKDAEMAIREELAQDMENPFLFALLSRALLEQDKPKEAEAAIQKSIQIEPDDDYAFYLLGRIQIARRQFRQAMESAEKAIALDPDDASNYGLKARIYYDTDKNEEALETLETGLAIDPENENCRFLKTLTLSEMGRHEEAETESLELLEDSPEDAYNHFALGQVRLDQGKSKAARVHFKEALRLEPESVAARAGLARAISLDQPLVGRLLRFFVLVSRLPMARLLLGFFVLLLVLNRLNTMADPWPAIGRGLRGGVYTLLFLALITNPLFSLTLYLSRNRQVLAADEQRAVRHFIAPLAIGFFFLALWLLNGAKDLPYHAIPWLAATYLFYEAFDTEQRPVRRWMMWLPWTGIALGLWALYAQFGILRPRALEIARTMAENGRDLDREAFISELRDLNQLRKNLIVWPCLFFWLLSLFSDHLRDFLVRRAPDR
ncbi:MAG: tetratricopeptide repeat protein [Verrucomicrobiota bacterium]